MTRWSEAYATGIESIDRQHRMIFQMTGDFRTALDEGGGQLVYNELLRSLDRYVRTHFRVEEECMERYRCAVADQNKRAHARFARVLDGMRERYEVVGYDPGDARQLITILEEWLANHICRIDIQLKGPARPSQPA